AHHHVCVRIGTRGDTARPGFCAFTVGSLAQRGTVTCVVLASFRCDVALSGGVDDPGSLQSSRLPRSLPRRRSFALNDRAVALVRGAACATADSATSGPTPNSG